MKAEDFDIKFDEGENVLKHPDLSKARRSEQRQKRVNVDFPAWKYEDGRMAFQCLGEGFTSRQQ